MTLVYIIGPAIGGLGPEFVTARADGSVRQTPSGALFTEAPTNTALGGTLAGTSTATATLSHGQVRVTATFLEVLRAVATGDTAIRVNQFLAEILRATQSGDTGVRATQIFVEVLRSGTVPDTGLGRPFLQVFI